jgi:hypothetical protein
MKNKHIIRMAAALALLVAVACQSQAAPLGTAFTYQGRLNDGAGAASGLYDFSFALYDAASIGTQQGSTLTTHAVSVTNGYLIVVLDFGSTFDGSARWLDIAVKTNGAAGYSALTPRQPLTPTPYAIYSANAGNATTASSATTATTANSFTGPLAGEVSGTQGATVVGNVGGQTAANVAGGASAANAATSANTASTIVKRDASGNFSAGAITAASFSGNGANVTALNASQLTSGAVSDARLSTNVALRNGTNTFTGSNTFAGVVMATNVNNVLHGTLTGNVVGNVTGNATTASSATTAASVGAGAVGAAGLQTGAVDSSKLADGSIGVSDLSPTVLSNTFWRLNGNAGTAPGAQFLGTTDNQPLELRVNNVRALRLEATANDANHSNIVNLVGGASINFIAPGVYGSVLAGGGAQEFNGESYTNSVSANFSFLGGGLGNSIQSNAASAFLGGGGRNSIQPAPYSFIGAGFLNSVETNAAYSFIGGGWHNTVSGAHGVVPGGQFNIAGRFGFAAGQRAQAIHDGTFVWADATDNTFTSTAQNQFLVRAAGNVGINKNNPATALDVNGTVTAVSFSGSGAGLTGLSAGSLSGTVADARLSANVPLLSAGKLSDSLLSANVALLSGSQTFTGAKSFSSPIHLNDGDIFFRGGADENHGVGWFGSGKEFAGVNLDGPVLYGCDGGGLGTRCNTNLALRWRNDGNVIIDPRGLNNGAPLPGLTFGNGSGEGIASKRTAGGNQFGLDFYTGFANRMSITSDGKVGIGTNSPTATLDIAGDARVRGLLRLGSEVTADPLPSSGIVVRPIYSATINAGRDVAKAGLLSLERDGTGGGFRVQVLALATNPDYYYVALTGITSSGTPVATYKTLKANTTQTIPVFTDAQGVVHFQGSLGLPGSYVTQVMLSRVAGSNVWTGTLTSTHNQ